MKQVLTDTMFAVFHYKWGCQENNPLKTPSENNINQIKDISWCTYNSIYATSKSWNIFKGFNFLRLCEKNTAVSSDFYFTYFLMLFCISCCEHVSLEKNVYYKLHKNNIFMGKNSLRICFIFFICCLCMKMVLNLICTCMWVHSRTF